VSLLGFYRVLSRVLLWYCLDATGVLQLDYYWGTTGLLGYYRIVLRYYYGIVSSGYSYGTIGPGVLNVVLLVHYCGTTVVKNVSTTRIPLGYYLCTSVVLLGYRWGTIGVLQNYLVGVLPGYRVTTGVLQGHYRSVVWVQLQHHWGTTVVLPGYYWSSIGVLLENY